MFDNKEDYAKYTVMPAASYTIIENLIKNPKAEIIWKLLKYNDADAYKKPNLTLEEKRALIYKGQSNQDEYNIFFDYMMDDAMTKETTLLRIYPAEVYPLTRVTGICTFNFEIFAHSKINHLDNYTTRVDTITQMLIELLNGTDIGGLGVLFFDNDVSRYDKVQSIGQKPYKGKLLKMSVNMG